MAFSDLLDHQCDIYHLIKESGSMGYGISVDKFVYPEEADEKDIDCHFNIADNGVLTQTESANEYTYEGKLQLPLGTKVYVNDKIVDKSNGLVYTAQVPRNIRAHHMVVKVFRKGTIKEAL